MKQKSPRRSRKAARTPLADIPLRRAEALATLLLRTVVPVAGVLFLGQDVKRLATLYVVDTWLALTMVFGLLGVHFMHERSAPSTSFERITTWASGWLLGGALATFFMAVAGLPLFFFVRDWRVLFADTTFLALLASHITASLIAFAREAAVMRGESDHALRLRHRFEMIFVRWLAVFVVLLMVAPILVRFWPAAPAFLLVLTYSAFTLFAELMPERLRRTLFGRERQSSGRRQA